MDHNRTVEPGIPEGTPPSEAWLFAQAILGRPVPRIVSAEATAKVKREELRRLAQLSTRHADELRKLEAAEAKARHDRELLRWAAQISTRAAAKLRALESELASEHEAWRRAERLCETSCPNVTEWNEADHPRQPEGSPEGGQWAPKGGGGGGRATPKVDVRTRSKTWNGSYGNRRGQPSTVTFKVNGNGVGMSGEHEQAVADAVVDAVDRFSEVADIIKSSRSQLKAQFANPNLLVGKMAHDDSLYATMRDNMERVVNGIKDGALVLDGDPKYTSRNEPLMYTNMNPLTYNARGEMHFNDRFVQAPHEEKVRALTHEFGRRWGRQYLDGLDTKWGVGAWDETIDRIYTQRSAIRKRG